MRYFSRRVTLEERRNKKKALLYFSLTLVLILLIAGFGTSSLARIASFISEIKKTKEESSKDDTTPPPPPVFRNIPRFTNQKILELSGYSEPGSTVIILLNEEENQTIANSEGKFFVSLTLKQGENTVSAYAKDSAGNESFKSQTFSINFDNQPPFLDVTTPSDGARFFGSKQRQVIIEGKTETQSKVFINDRMVVVDKEGNFSYLTTLNEGENKFTIKAKDEAENEQEKTLVLFFSP